MFELIPFDRRGSRVSAYDPFRMLDDMERSFFGGANHPAMSSFRTDVTDTGDAFVLDEATNEVLPGLDRGPDQAKRLCPVRHVSNGTVFDGPKAVFRFGVRLAGLDPCDDLIVGQVFDGSGAGNGQIVADRATLADLVRVDLVHGVHCLAVISSAIRCMYFNRPSSGNLVAMLKDSRSLPRNFSNKATSRSAAA